MDLETVNNPQPESVVNQPTAVPVSPTPKPKSKLPLILVVIVLLVMVGAGGIVLGKYLSDSKTPETTQPIVTVTTSTPTPTLNPTANWEIYSNTKYNYLFMYAKNSDLKQFSCLNINSSQDIFKKGDDQAIFDEVSSTFPECGAGGYAYPIAIRVDQVKPTVDTCVSEGWQSTKSQILISGITASKCVMKFTGKREMVGPDTLERIKFQNGSNYFNLELTNIKYQTTFDQILSTFRFD